MGIDGEAVMSANQSVQHEVQRDSEVARNARMASLQERVQNVLRVLKSDESIPESGKPEQRCQHCAGLGWIGPRIVSDNAEPNIDRQICTHCETGRKALERRWSRIFQEAATPTRYQVFSLQDWRNLHPRLSDGKKLAIAMAWEFVRQPDHYVSLHQSYSLWDVKTTLPETVRNWLIFQGSYGLGKTSLALTISNELVQQNKMCLFIRAADFLEAVQRLYNKDKARELKMDSTTVVDQARKAPILILDDFNADVVGETEKLIHLRQGIIEQVIRWRYNNALPTIITLNDTQEAIREAWGQRIVSPMLDAAHWIPMGGKPLRDERPPMDIF
jgi:hypothetical protein